MAARSPACWMAGPEEIRRGTSSSSAMIMARVVLPRPGGPESSTWSAVRPRNLDASSTSESCARTRFCPTKLSSVPGRSDASSCWSS